MREKILKNLAKFHANHPWRMLVIVVVLTIIFLGLASRLKVTMRWSDLLPSKDRRTISFNKIINEFVSATSIVVVVQGKEELIKSFAEEAVPKIKLTVDPKDYKPFVRRVDYKQEIDFIKSHGLMLIRADDLKNMKDVYKNPNLAPLLENINNSIEKEYVGREESLSTREKEDGAFVFLDGIQNLIDTIQRYVQEDLPEKSLAQDHNNPAQQAVDKILFGEPYILSYDKTTLILNVIPNFTMMDMEKLVDGVDAVQEVVDSVLEDYPDVTAGLTGFIPVAHDEMVYSEKSIGYTTVIALIAVFFLLVISFRMWIAPVLGLLNLVVGIIWAMGLAFILVGTLNIMTYMMAVILIGLGIDFSIHMISGFTEGRSLGKQIQEAMEETFLKSGKGILTGGLTTSIAFLTLSISSSRGMKELGVIAGGGLVAILIVTFLFLPSLLVLREHRFEKKRKKGKLRKEFTLRDISFKSLGNIGKFLSLRYLATIIASILVTAFLILSATKISFDQNYMNLEPKGLPSVTLQDIVLEKFDLSMDYAMILTDNAAESRATAEKAKDIGSVALAEDISLYLPSKTQQESRIPFINEIRKAIGVSEARSAFSREDYERSLQELGRLEMNIIEIQDLAYLGGQDKVDSKCAEIVGEADDPEPKSLIKDLIKILEKDRKMTLAGLEEFQRDFAPYFKKSVIQMSLEETVKFENLPASILDRYTNKERTKFLVTIFPGDNIWQDAEFLKRFVEDLERVSENTTGMPPVFRALIEIVARDGRNAILLALVVVFFVLWLDYKNPGHALMAMIPLTIGVFWMVGMMGLAGMKLTVMSVMGLPMIVGIGVDDGVHIVHRWRIEGKGKITQIFASTGKAILLTSATTMLAFGSLVFSVWPGFASLGVAMFIGVGACFLSTVIILSGILGLLERQK
ncbi:MAG: MMPL family transporter [Candidatus Aminicenantes bacterium]|nr:MMPL family transporter [Candidatus Aminicenantes bacterium]